jgi:ATP-dependent helicase/DNAse subunit B
MAKQFNSPLWVSHTSISDFLSCPRAYYLRHIYKDPKTGRKINIINPAMALGLVVHDVLEALADVGVDVRMQQSLIESFEKAWEHVSGEMGGFRDRQEEEGFKYRGLKMIQRAIEHPGPLLKKVVRLRSPDSLPPRYKLSEEENIILCGKVDWLEYFPDDDSVRIIDFKTGVKEERADSLQLPIYALLVKNLQNRNIRGIAYWYLERDDAPIEMGLPDFLEAHKRVMGVALAIKKLRQEGRYVCSRGGCFSCRPLEDVIDGRAKWIKQSGYVDVYVNLG